MESIYYYITNDLFSLIITLCAMLAVLWVYRAIGAEKMQQLESLYRSKQSLAEDAVRYAQQKFSDTAGPNRYQVALTWATQQAKKYGINTTEQELDGLIHSALRQFKDEFGEDWAKLSSTGPSQTS